MGLCISVNERGYYSHSYGALHLIRLFAAKKEYPNEKLDKETMYNHQYTRFRALIEHSDCGYGYVPEGIAPPYTKDGIDPTWQWPPTEELLRELEDLEKYRAEMTEEVSEMHVELLEAAKASIKEKKPIEFH